MDYVKPLCDLCIFVEDESGEPLTDVHVESLSTSTDQEALMEVFDGMLVFEELVLG